MARKVEGTINLTNEQPSEISLRLEPWGDIHPIPSGKSVAVTLHGSATEVDLHIFTKPGVIELWVESRDLVLEIRSA